MFGFKCTAFRYMICNSCYRLKFKRFGHSVYLYLLICAYYTQITQIKSSETAKQPKNNNSSNAVFKWWNYAFLFVIWPLYHWIRSIVFIELVVGTTFSMVPVWMSNRSNIFVFISFKLVDSFMWDIIILGIEANNFEKRIAHLMMLAWVGWIFVLRTDNDLILYTWGKINCFWYCKQIVFNGFILSHWLCNMYKIEPGSSNLNCALNRYCARPRATGNIKRGKQKNNEKARKQIFPLQSHEELRAPFILFCFECAYCIISNHIYFANLLCCFF